MMSAAGCPPCASTEEDLPGYVRPKKSALTLTTASSQPRHSIFAYLLVMVFVAQITAVGELCIQFALIYGTFPFM
ncbi:hypothetical protein Q1695_005297 [Nippostrongylus brasiliensis]|nr:hypothetical protein Q1695_005297 [Nippostrongylus brasiliensis]